MSIAIQTEDFDLATELSMLRALSPEIGALVSFVGLVREFGGANKIDSIYLEHYPGMCEKALNKIIAEAHRRWQLQGVRVIHRVGRLKPSDQIVLVATAASHRASAFAACEFIIDYLKTAAPFWKKEESCSDTTWLATKKSDIDRMQRWFPEGDMQ